MKEYLQAKIEKTWYFFPLEAGLAGVRTLREGLYLMTHAFRSYHRHAL